MVIDSASINLSVGVARGSNWLAYKAKQVPTLEGFFSLASGVLDDCNMALADLEGFVFCEGPGSILSVRMIAMAMRTWKILFEEKFILGFRNFDLMKCSIIEKSVCSSRTFAIASPSTMNKWNFMEVQNKSSDKIIEVDNDFLQNWEKGTLFVYSGGKKSRAELDIKHEKITYDMQLDLRVLFKYQEYILHESPSPDAFVCTQRKYKKWKGPS